MRQVLLDGGAGHVIAVLIHFPVLVSQLSVVQKSLSSQVLFVIIHPATGSQLIDWHLLDGVMEHVIGVLIHFPVFGSQLSVVQTLLSSQVLGEETHPTFG